MMLLSVRRLLSTLAVLAVLLTMILAGPASAQEFAPAVVFDMGGKFDKSFNEAAYVGAERFKVRGESLEGQERTEALARIAAIAPRYGAYQQKTDREIPVVRLTREA